MALGVLLVVVVVAVVVVVVLVSLVSALSADLTRCKTLAIAVVSASTKRLVLKMAAGLEFQAPSCERTEAVDDVASKAPPRGKVKAMHDVVS